MANFKTHLVIATAASSAVAIVASSIQLIALKDLLEFICLGAIGGLLPDIDASNSKPARLLFTSLGLMLSLLALWFCKTEYSAAYLVLIACGTFIFVRHLVFRIFNHFTVHRGVFHSILAAIFFALLTICSSYYLLHCKALQAWLSGCFVAFGFIVHLVLDECYSVDLANKRMKKSFGTALKLWNYKNLTASLLMALSVLALLSITPSAGELIRAYKKLNWQDYLIQPLNIGGLNNK